MLICIILPNYLITFRFDNIGVDFKSMFCVLEKLAIYLLPFARFVRVFSSYIKDEEPKPDATNWGKKMTFGNLMAEFSNGGGRNLAAPGATSTSPTNQGPVLVRKSVGKVDRLEFSAWHGGVAVCSNYLLLTAPFPTSVVSGQLW